MMMGRRIDWSKHDDEIELDASLNRRHVVLYKAGRFNILSHLSNYVCVHYNIE